jgi:hypothetical protein
MDDLAALARGVPGAFEQASGVLCEVRRLKSLDVRIGGDGAWRENLRTRGAKLYGFYPVAGSPR